LADIRATGIFVLGFEEEPTIFGHERHAVDGDA
jgi:hypothetical protein